MKPNASLWIVLCATLMWSTAHAASGILLRNETLRTQPAATAAVSAHASKGTAVSILSRRGGWLQVRTGRAQGWVRLLSVRAGSGGSGGAGLGDVVGIATNRSNPSRVVAVAGVRGLNEEDLKEARFSPEQLARLDSYAVSPSQARTNASRAKLVTANVPSLPKPQSGSGSSSSNSNSPWEDKP